jgi:TP901 family phage tail tape measure protein
MIERLSGEKMPNTNTIQFNLQPTFDANAFNIIIQNIQKSLGELGKGLNLKPIDVNAFKSTFDNAVKASEDAGKKISETLNNSINNNLPKSLDFSKLFNAQLLTQAMSQIEGIFANISAPFIQFEKQLADLSAITGVSGAGLDDLGEKARSLALKFGGDASGQIEAFKGVLSRLGPDIAKSPEALERMAEAINTVSKASGLDATASMDALTTSMLQFGVDLSDPVKAAGEMEKMMNTLAAGAKYGAAEIPQVSDAVKVAGVAAYGAKLSFEETNAAIQAMATGGKVGAEAGTALRNVLGKLQDQSGEGSKQLKAMGLTVKQLGESLTTKGLSETLKLLGTGFDKLGTDAEKNAALMNLFGTENAAAAGIMLRNADAIKTMTGQLTGTNTATEQASINMNTISASAERFKAKMTDMAISVGQTLGSFGISAASAVFEVGKVLQAGITIKSVIPDSVFQNIGQFGLQITSKLIPALVTQDVLTQKMAFNQEAFNLATIKGSIAQQAHAAKIWIVNGAEATWAATKNALTLSNIKNTAGLVAHSIAVGASATATGIATAATWAWNAALNANPISLIILGMLGLIGTFVLLYKNVESVQNFFDKFWIGIKAGISGIVEGFSTVFDGIGKIFTGDFSGAIDSFSKIGSNAAGKFNEEFQKGAEKLNFENTQKKLDEAFSKGTEINIKVKEQENFKSLISQYENAQNEINKLNQKAQTGDLTSQEKALLESSKQKAQATAEAIGKVAPAVRENFKAITDSQGNLSQVYDINIAKANEFASSISLQGKQESVKAYSESLVQQTSTIDSQIERQKALKQQIDVTNDPKAKQELIDKYNEENKLLDENKNKVIENAVKGAEAGLMTEEAFNKVGQSIGKTGAEVKSLALDKELQKAAKEGSINNALIDTMAQKYGKSKEEVQALVDKTKAQQKAQESATEAVIKMSDALDAINKKLKEGFNNDKNEAVFIKSVQTMAKKGGEAWTKFYESLDSEAKKKADKALTYSDAEIKGIAKKAKTQQETIKYLDETIKLSEKELGLEETKSKKTKSSSESKKSKYEIAKKLYEDTNKRITDEQEQKQAEINLSIAEQGRLKTKIELQNEERDSLRFKTEELKRQKEEAEQLLLIAQKSLKKSDITDAEARVRELSLKITEASTKELNFVVNLKTEDDKNALEIAKIQKEIDKSELEYKVKMGLALESDLVNFTLNDLQKELDEQNSLKIKLETSGEDPVKLAQTKERIISLQRSISEAQLKIDEQLDKERINQLSDFAVKSREQKISDAKKTYAEEYKLAINNIFLQSIAYQKFLDSKRKAEQEYYYESNALFAASQDFVEAMKNSSVTKTDNSKEIEENKKNYDKDLANLQQSLDKKELSQREFYAKKESLQRDYLNKENDLNAKSVSLFGQSLEALNNALGVSFSSMSAKYTKAYEDNFKKKEAYDLASIGITKEISKKESEYFIAGLTNNYEKQAEILNQIDGLKNQQLENDKARNLITEELQANMILAFGSQVATMIITGENAGKAVAKSAISILKSLIPIFVAQIFGITASSPANIATLGIWGATQFALLTGALYGLASIAESAVGRWKGDVRIKGKGTRRSDEIPSWLSAGESVLTADATDAPFNYDFFMFANAKGSDGSVHNWLKQTKEGRSLLDMEIKNALKFTDQQKNVMVNMAVDRSIENEKLNELRQINNSLIIQNQILTTKIDELIEVNKRGNFARSQKLNLGIEVETNDNKIIDAIQVKQIKRLRLA